jgi:phage terminase Nu1 subunit (DNA packaging protein)
MKRKPKSKSPALSPDQAEQMLQANRANIAKKLARGVTLTKREVDELEGVQTGKTKTPADIDLAGSMSQAANMLGTSMAVAREAKRQGCPAFRGNNTVHLPTFRKWLADHNVEPDKSEPKHLSESRYLRAKADRAEIIVATQRRTLIPAEIMRRSFTRAIIAFKTRLLTLPDNFAQRFAVMADPTEIREAMRLGINEALSELAKCEWAKEAA